MTQTQDPTTARPVGTGQTQDQHLEALGRYEWGWADSDIAGATAQRGLTPQIVANISKLKNEPEWM
ncbi:MAG TPA: Fe-S cluster assembly protein SufB, partial [Propionibacteriaceae bacterium]|nr:Fe-S cluster assembly protein SufB [Propionibacteriaceae bacterium]